MCGWCPVTLSTGMLCVCVCVSVCQCVPVLVYRSGCRMLLEVFTIEPGELLPKATGVRLVELGLSYVLPDSAVPPCYRQAWLQSGDGVHAPNLHGLAECDALAPWQIKNVLMQPDDETTEQWAHSSLQVSCSVRNKVDHLNEANLLIRIPGAGSGQFLRPTPLPPGNQLRIPDGKRICLRRPLPSEVAAESAYH